MNYVGFQAFNGHCSGIEIFGFLVRFIVNDFHVLFFLEKIGLKLLFRPKFNQVQIRSILVQKFWFRCFGRFDYLCRTQARQNMPT